METGDGHQPVLTGHPVAAAARPVADAAINGVTFLPALEQFGRDRQGKTRPPLVAETPGVLVVRAGGVTHHAVFALVGKWVVLGNRRLVADRHRAGHRQTVAAVIGKKITRHLGLHFRLMVHIGEDLDRRLAAFLSAETGHRSQQHEKKPEGDEEVAQHISPRKSA